MNDEGVAMHGAEPSGRSLDEPGEHAATLTLGEPGIIHGFKTYMLKDEEGEPAPVYSVASGLDYPGVGPQHSYLKDLGRVQYGTVGDTEAIDAFFELSRLEGIIPAIESAHALAHAFNLAKANPDIGTILINLSGRGDKDIDFIAEQYGADYGI
jgi:tryptophan synthase beta chain